jgi:aminocarboxymuconate-semialdehyde decarboxylase
MTEGRIDVHAHAFPEEYLREVARTYPSDVGLGRTDDGRLVAVWAEVPVPGWDPVVRLAEMDRDGVIEEVLSAPIVYGWLDERTDGFCRLLNDFQAEVAREHPGRFRSFIHLPVHQPSAAEAELQRWQGRPEVAGVVLGSNMGSRYPGDKAFMPIWRAIADLDLAVFIHPVQPAARFGSVAPPIVLFPCDTTVAAASLIYGGMLERFPALRIILSHYGGALPMLARRLDMGVEISGFPAGHGQDLPHPPSSYVGRFYADTAQGFHEPAFRCASATFGLDHILYGSDGFFENSTWRQSLNEFLDGLKLTEQEAGAVLSGNAHRVLAHGNGPPLA